MTLSNTTTKLLDLFSDLAADEKLVRHDVDTILKGITYAQKRAIWPIVAKLAAELGSRNGLAKPQTPPAV